MLEHPSIRRYSSVSHLHRKMEDMGSDNPIGADNQQETRNQRVQLDAQWVSGFVDGEGCFSVSFHRNPHVRRTRGWQIQAAFQVYQHERYRPVLEALIDLFGCGAIHSKGANSSVLTYSVWRLDELESKIVPFFEGTGLVVKDRDFQLFADIVRRLRRKEHMTATGFERIVRSAYAMNQHGKQRSRTLEQVLRGSSETVRQAPSKG